MNSLTNRSASNAPGLTPGSPHHDTTRSGSSARLMGSSRVTTWVIAARTLFCQVRAEKKPARCAASWTLSEKAMALGSSLWREANV